MEVTPLPSGEVKLGFQDNLFSRQRVFFSLERTEGDFFFFLRRFSGFAKARLVTSLYVVLAFVWSFDSENRFLIVLQSVQNEVDEFLSLFKCELFSKDIRNYIKPYY